MAWNICIIVFFSIFLSFFTFYTYVHVTHTILQKNCILITYCCRDTSNLDKTGKMDKTGEK